MRTFITIIITINLNLSLFSQIGINTDKPQQVLHIDGNGDTDNSVNTIDDVVITREGNWGIGTTHPETKLDIYGKLQYITSENQEDISDYILTSDPEGNAEWRNNIRPQTIETLNIGSILYNTTIYPVSTFMGPSITLPPGTWQINFSATYELYQYNKPLNIIWDLTNSPSVNTESTRKGRAYSAAADGPPNGPQQYGCYTPVSATYLVSHTVETTYYIWAYSPQLSGSESLIDSYTGEGRLWSFLINN